jgi:hypothetical protein
MCWTAFLAAAGFGQGLDYLKYSSSDVGKFTFVFGGGEIVGCVLVGMDFLFLVIFPLFRVF